MTEVDPNKVSPMMQHYLQTKEKYPDCILFYRLGDFYEMFFEDAKTVSRVLQLTLTGKSCGLPERAPMCGVPFHAAETYINKLVSTGLKVAVCEQLEDPKLAKGIVKRDVIRVVTPGTNTNVSAMEEDANSYIMCIFYEADLFGVSIADVTTGDFLATELSENAKLMDEIAKYSPKEILVNEAFPLSGISMEDMRNTLHVMVSALPSRHFDPGECSEKLLSHFKVMSLEGLGLGGMEAGALSAGALLGYLLETQKNDLGNITRITPYQTVQSMIIDSSTRRNLELTESMREKSKKGTLLWILDKAKTAMGSRMLRHFIEQPLTQKEAIEERLDAVGELSEKLMDRDEIREYLSGIYDIERLMCRVCFGTAGPRDLIALKNSLSQLSPIRMTSSGFQSALLQRKREEIDEMTDLIGLIDRCIEEEPPVSARDGGVVKDGYNEEVDRLRRIKTEGKQWLVKLEADTRERTGIKNLKIKFNKVFGYYFEVSNSFLKMVPEDFIRKQTLTTGERFTTDELKKMEDEILNSEERLFSLEYQLFCEVRKTAAEQMERLTRTASAVAVLDALASLSYVAEHSGYVRPRINEEGVINIKDGRHPVVEKMIRDGSFISNDVYLDQDQKRISIITGPNMAGKSTYMRQTALIVLMSAIGSFVPAKEADICITDRIFTRVGASDDLASGQSTFMVEMTEVANILRNATANSLLILDEIGRGTSTYDGLAIAWAVVEHISNPKLCGAKTLFATHYHELTELQGKIPCVNNYCFAVKEHGDDVVFLRKIVEGGADRSYGIQVAKLAGVPESVIERAKVIVEELSDNDIAVRVREMAVSGKASQRQKRADEVELYQMSLFDTMKDDDIITELKNLDLPHMTPIDALNALARLQSLASNRYGKDK